MPVPRVIPQLDPLLGVVREGALLHASPAHGEGHWLAVAATGLDLHDHALAHGAPRPDPLIVVLFGLLHDCRRENEAVDPEHGHRACEVAISLRDAGLLHLSDADFDVLTQACRLHDSGAVELACATIGTCYDADRLQLPRVGIAVDLRYISTPAGRDPEMLARVLDHHNHPELSWHDLLTRAARPRS